MRISITRLVSLCAALALPTSAYAYVGPGAGISLLGALWGLILGVVIALGILIIWPIRMMRKRKAEQQAADADSGATELRRDQSGTGVTPNEQA